ncbi:hypothetical protein D3C79_966810 [compost metagenome]
MLLGQLRQCIEVGLFQAAPLVEVAQQALAHGQQVGTRFANFCQRLRAGQDTQEGILAEVGGIPGIAHAPPQPGFQPAAMGPVQGRQAMLRWRRGVDHGEGPAVA